jgi:DNA repair photolyase
MTFYEIQAKSIISRVPAASRMPFEWTINPYRGCSHACVYCQTGDTPILMADGRTRPLADIRVGDEVFGTVPEAGFRRYVPTTVLDHWETLKPAYRSRWPTAPSSPRAGTTVPDQPGLEVRHRGHPRGGPAAVPHHGQQAHGHREVRRAAQEVRRVPPGLPVRRAQGAGPRRRPRARPGPAGTSRGSTWRGSAAEGVAELTAWPALPADDWHKGFLAGVFDARGTGAGSIRIGSADATTLGWIQTSLRHLGFRCVLEPPRVAGWASQVRILGGLSERLRFFHTVDPSLTRKRVIAGTAVKSDVPLDVVSVTPLGLELPMYDITTGTGDFIANGVVSHNCFARNTHTYLDLDAGHDFDSKVVVKVNAPELLRRELAAPKWTGASIAMGTNVDCYQRAEGRYELMRGIIAALRDFANPFSILTKGTLITRDLDLLRQAAEVTRVSVSFSVGFVDEAVWHEAEPGTPSPRRRLTRCGASPTPASRSTC